MQTHVLFSSVYLEQNPRFAAQYARPSAKSFIIRTYNPVAKQATLTTFRMNTFEKKQERVRHIVNRLMHPKIFLDRAPSGTVHKPLPLQRNRISDIQSISVREPHVYSLYG
jgi:hypothetical protein